MAGLFRIRKNKEPVETKTSSGTFGNEFVGMNTGLASSYSNPAKVYADTSFVYEIVSGIAKQGSTFPLKFLKSDGKGHNMPDDSHPAVKLMRKPNGTTSRSTFIQATAGWMSLHGNAFWLKLRNRSGQVVELEILRADYMHPLVDENQDLVGWRFGPGSQDIERFLASEIIHFRDWSPLDPYLGASPITSLRYEIQLGKDGESAAIDLWQNGAKFPGILVTPEQLDEDELENIQRSFRAGTRKGSRFSAPVLTGGLNWQTVGMSPQDAEFINTMKLSRERVASAYNWALPEQYPGQGPDAIRKARLLDAVHPILTNIEETLEVQLMSEWPGTSFPQFKRNAIWDGDLPALATAYKDLVYAGIAPPEWVRGELDIPPGMDTFIPLNMSRIDGVTGEVVSTPRVTETEAVPPDAAVGNDTSGGMGGDQGQGQGGTGNGNAKAWDINRKECESCGSKDLSAGMCLHCPPPSWLQKSHEAPRAKASGYAQTQNDLNERQSTALVGRVKGAFKSELKAIKSLGDVKATVNVSEEDLVKILGATDTQVKGLLEEFMKNTSHRAYEAANEYLGSSTTPEATAAAMTERIPKAIGFLRTGMSDGIKELFGKVASGEIDMRSLKVGLEDLYGAAAGRAEGVARTEVAFAANNGALDAFKAAGATDVEFLRGGGDCTTGECDDLDGQKYAISEAPDVPVHPNCTCALIPALAS